MRFRLFDFIKEGFKGVFRNGLMSFASIFVLLSSLLMIGIFTTVIRNVNVNLAEMENFKELVCYLDTSIGEEPEDERLVEEVEAKIAKLDNVVNVTFVSKDDALESEKEKYGDDEGAMLIFEMYENGTRTNPLPHAFRVEYASVEKLEALQANLELIGKGEEGRETGYIVSIRNSSEIAQNIENLKRVVTIGGSWLMILLIFISIFVISNTIKITYHSRELEIGIMRYIGATKFYITMPFIFESIIISLVSATIGYFSQYYIYNAVITALEDYSFIKVIPYSELEQLFLILYFGAALAMGVFGSIISIRKYMKV